ncbi:MAG: hypothetical protein WA984_03435 [Phormidesmis sp.]
MDAFDEIENSIRRREEQIKARAQQRNPKELKVSAPISPKAKRPQKMPAAGKFCMLALVAVIATHIASSVGTIVILIGVSILLVVRLASWVGFACCVAWIVHQLLKSS